MIYFHSSREAASLSKMNVQSGWTCKRLPGHAGENSPCKAALIAAALCFPVASSTIFLAWRMVATPAVRAQRGTSLGSVKKRPTGGQRVMKSWR
jgi:hypothetical protein